MDELDDLEIARLTNLLSGALVAQMVSAAAILGLADALGSESASSKVLAQRCGADVDSLHRLLRGLGSVGVIEALGPDLFALTDMGHLLRTDHPRSLSSWAAVQAELIGPLWGGLAETVRSGETSAQKVLGRPLYEHLSEHPDLDDRWNRAMAETAAAWFLNDDLLNSIDWSTIHRVVDVGGGRGGLLAGILRRHPHLSGVLYDLPHVVSHAPALLEGAGVLDRTAVLGGDMFERVPGDGDVYVLARVVFNWGEEAALRLLQACGAAMSDDASLLIIDQVLPEDDLPHPVKINDVNLMSMTSGRVRTLKEWRALADGAGFCTRCLSIAISPGSPWASLTLRRYRYCSCRHRRKCL